MPAVRTLPWATAAWISFKRKSIRRSISRCRRDCLKQMLSCRSSPRRHARNEIYEIMNRNGKLRAIPALGLICVLALAGCKKSHSDLVPVSGHVMIDGKPVTMGQITIMPDGHRVSFGKLDKDGRFT